MMLDDVLEKTREKLNCCAFVNQYAKEHLDGKEGLIALHEKFVDATRNLYGSDYSWDYSMRKYIFNYKIYLTETKLIPKYYKMKTLYEELSDEKLQNKLNSVTSKRLIDFSIDDYNIVEDYYEKSLEFKNMLDLQLQEHPTLNFDSFQEEFNNLDDAQVTSDFNELLQHDKKFRKTILDC